MESEIRWVPYNQWSAWKNKGYKGLFEFKSACYKYSCCCCSNTITLWRKSSTYIAPCETAWHIGRGLSLYPGFHIGSKQSDIHRLLKLLFQDNQNSTTYDLLAQLHINSFKVKCYLVLDQNYMKRSQWAQLVELCHRTSDVVDETHQ